jgi:hypothetical protein
MNTVKSSLETYKHQPLANAETVIGLIMLFPGAFDDNIWLEIFHVTSLNHSLRHDLLGRSKQLCLQDVRFCRLSKEDFFFKSSFPTLVVRKKIRAVRRNLTIGAFRAIHGSFPTLDLTRVCIICRREKSSGSEALRSKPFCWLHDKG